MTVLIVDDQINVVSGLVLGIHWDKIGITKVLKAYNAYEAKEQLKKTEADIVLCDIEMPVENGLSLQGTGIFFKIHLPDSTCRFYVCKRGDSVRRI